MHSKHCTICTKWKEVNKEYYFPSSHLLCSFLNTVNHLIFYIYSMHHIDMSMYDTCYVRDYVCFFYA